MLVNASGDFYIKYASINKNTKNILKNALPVLERMMLIRLLESKQQSNTCSQLKFKELQLLSMVGNAMNFNINTKK